MPQILKLNSLGGISLYIVLLFVGHGLIHAADAQSSFDRISDAYKAGSITKSEMLVQQMTALFAPDKLATEYKSAGPSVIKSGTGLIAEVRDNWEIFAPEEQSLLSSYMGRPTNLPDTYDSPEGNFKIHYSTVPPEGVPPQDLNSNLVPDYVERIADYCDSARSVYNALGYLPPPSDGTSGGDDKYDIYLAAIGAYGMTTQDGPGDSVWDDYKSYIWIHNTMSFPGMYDNDDPDGDTIGAQKVTAAHEYFHATQFAYKYNPGEFLWLMELTATWMEEVVFPIVNDNYGFLQSFFNYPQYSLTLINGYHEYGSFIWGAYLSQKYDSDIILRMWEAARYNTSVASCDSALAPYGTTVKKTMADFMAWNYFTGERAQPGQYYADAADYPLVAIAQTFPTLVHDSIQPIDGPDGMASNYIRFDVDTSARGILEILLEGSPLVRWADVGIASDVGVDSVYIAVSTGPDPTRIYFSHVEDYATITAVPNVITPYQTDNNYYLTCKLIPYGDANYDYETNVGDAFYLVNHVFRGGAAPQPVPATGDANCDGDVNVADAVTIINYVFKGGAVPCAARMPQ